ncbi:hypothetical protein [Corynebacterium sp. ES2715-CONJ3]|uniref:hypothetical protein n=1 Tax=Corynebacterium sp. ES2715-CONJ3 TaxID=2974028 RepID=UPI002166DD9C|nr:hypothetical protein [Corynebacterium sp. ES2715-CONJ3]MCS4491264.1 hypothetical protein [Corynebacterium sp. ES2715-CONJ3]
MSEKQLTVAELLARAGKEEAAEPTRRRRRRSLDEGGVSVAELTGSIPKVEAKPAEAKHSSEPLDPDPEDTPVTVVAEDVTSTPTSTEPEVIVDNVNTSVNTEDEADSADETVVLSVVREDEPVRLTTSDFPAQEKQVAVADLTEKKPPATGYDVEGQPTPVFEEEEAAPVEEETRSISVLSVILMVVVGSIIGFSVFAGFEYLWGHFSKSVVGALALGATAGLVVVVKILRTSHDIFSMALAAVVGLVITFGPLLVVGF